MFEQAVIGGLAAGVFALMLIGIRKLSMRGAVAISVALIVGTFLLDQLSSRGPSAESETPPIGAPFSLYDEDWFHACMIESAKGSATREGLRVLQDACAHRAVPKVCRGLSETDGVPDPEPPQRDRSFTRLWDDSPLADGERSSRARCVKQCSGATYLSRTFGECAKG